MSIKMPTSMKRLTLVVLVVALATGIFVVSANGNPHVSPRVAHARLHRALVAMSHRTATVRLGRRAPARVLVRDFRVIRAAHSGAHSASASYPVAVAGLIDHEISGNGVAGQYVAGAATVTEVQNGGWPNPVWVVAGSNGACVITMTAVNRSVGDCQTAASAAEYGVGLLLDGGNGSESMVGFVPNTNQSITAVTGNGVQETIPVTNNVYFTSSQSGFAKLTVDSASGVAETHTYTTPG